MITCLNKPFQPCGMLAPHIHPRATEILVNVGGPPLMIGIIPEEGAPGEFFLLSLVAQGHN